MNTLDQGFQERVMHLAGWELPQKLPALTQSFLAEVQSTRMLQPNAHTAVPHAVLNCIQPGCLFNEILCVADDILISQHVSSILCGKSENAPSEGH